MKKHLFLALAATALLASCSDNDTEDTNPNPNPSSVTLHKTVTYFPTEENYVTRNVKYFDDNMHIVADSTYGPDYNFISRKIHTYNASNYTIDVKNIDDVTVASAAEQYDAQGRLTTFIGFEGHYEYTYTDNTVSVDYLDPAGAFINIGVFTYNEDGMIAAHTELMGDVISSATSLQFSNINRPSALMAQGITGPIEEMGNFSYYPNSMPSIFEKSTVQINNEVLKALKLEASALLGNYFLQDFTLGSDVFYHSDIVFNPASGLENYPQHQTVTIAGQPFSRTYYFFQN